MGLKETLQIIIKAEDEASKVIKQVQKQTENLSKTKVSSSGLNNYNKQIKLTEEQLRSLGRYGNQAMSMMSTNVPISKMDKLKSSVASFGTKASSAFSKASAKCKSLGDSLINTSSSTKSLISGIVGVDLAMQMWEASTEKQTNTLLLARKYGVKSANDIQKAISDVVTKTPGDDTFLTSMLSTASLKAKMTTKDLQNMASAIADYKTMSKAQGSTEYESQGEIRNYLMSGETGRMRDTPLAPYLDDLEDADTPIKRVEALNKALKELGYSGASGMNSASNSMETFKGTMQNAMAQVGLQVLPVIQSLLDNFLRLDSVLGGNLSKGLVIAGGGLLAFVGTAKVVGYTIRTIGDSIDYVNKHITLENFQKKFNSIGNTVNNVKSKITSFTNSISNSFSSFKSSAINTISQKFQALQNTVTNTGGRIKTFASSMSSTLSSLKSSAITSMSQKLTVLKNTLITVSTQAKTLAINLLNAGRSALTAGLNALRSATMWVVQKVQMGLATIATYAQTAAQWALNIAMSMNPISLVVIAIAGLIAILVVLYMRCEPVRNLFNSIGGAIYRFAMILWTNVQHAVQIAITYFRLLIAFISSIPARIGAFLASIPARIMSFLGSIRSSAMSLGRGILNGIIQFVTSIPNRIAQELGKIPSRIMGAVGNVVNAAKNFGKSILNGVMNALGIHSPGFIQNNISNEFEALSGRIKEALPETLNTVNSFGDKLVDSASNMDIKANVTPMANPTPNAPTPNAPTPNAPNINTEQAQAELDKLKLIMNTDLNLITNTVSNTLKLINNQLKISFNSNTTYVSAKMKVLLASLTSSTKKMVNAFNTMKNGVVNSARTMQSQTNSWISKLKSNISNFYNSIRHIGGAGGGAGTPTHRASRPNRSGAGGGSNIMKKLLKDSIYFKGLKNVDFPLEALLSGTLKHKGGAGGLFDNNKIKNIIRKYKTGNAQVGRYKTSHLSFPVSSFENKKPKITFSMFKALAEDVFSQISYLFYYDSTRWGSWQNAFRHGQMNCSDGSDALIALAHACGLSASKVHGHWGKYGHFWANVAGHKMDTTGFTTGKGWTPSQSHAGSPPKSFSTDNLNNPNDYSDNLNISGSVTIVHDLRNVPSGLDENMIVELLNKSTVDNPSWIRELVTNRTFQNQDRRVKDRLRGNANRSAGI